MRKDFDQSAILRKMRHQFQVEVIDTIVFRIMPGFLIKKEI